MSDFCVRPNTEQAKRLGRTFGQTFGRTLKSQYFGTLGALLTEKISVEIGIVVIVDVSSLFLCQLLGFFLLVKFFSSKSPLFFEKKL